MIESANETTEVLETNDVFVDEDHIGEQPSIEIRNLHRFFGRLKAVNNVSFKAFPGQVMGFIGPNGAGKTTTMRILATLDLPTAGDAFICGHSVVDDPEKARRELGFMPDSFGKYNNMDVIEYLDFYARAYGYKGEERRNAIDKVLVFTELRKMAFKPINTLSKGMSQRLCLGRTLIHDPQVLILDEPAAGLDPRARVELRELIHLLATEMNKTILISSHILTELGEICDSAAIIEAGEILIHGTIDDLRNHRPKHKQGQDAGEYLIVSVLSQEQELEKWLLEQPFVSEVSPTAMQFSFYFTGDKTQQTELLKGMIQKQFPVLEFSGKSETLEDAFMSITEGIVQ
ncbi:MAG: ABC transporter ATP-binding protein [Planctomycetaceae bacterium]|nr:ABC transporter ATP-binding protein [Planctomycetaceae bacterium]